MKNKIKYILKNMDKGLLAVTIFLFFFGLINIVTASSREAVVVNKAGIYYYFYRQMIILTIGFIGSCFVLSIPTKKYYKLWWILYIVTIALVCVCFFISSTRGAKNWIPLGFFQLQPSEIAKPVIILSLAVLFEKYAKKLKNPDVKHKTLIGFFAIVGFLIPILIFLQKDLGTALIISSISFMMLLISPVLKSEKLKILKVISIAVCLVLVVLLLTTGHILTNAQLSRFDYFNPCSKYEDGGYQICNAYIAFNDGGLTGLGIGKSKQKYSYIPEPHTDSIFAIIAEEWGFIGASVGVFLPYAFLLYRLYRISSKASTPRGKYICVGISTYIFAHIFINLGGLFGLIPLTGVPLPFLSYGGSYTICLMMSLAMAQRVHIETKTKRIKLD